MDRIYSRLLSGSSKMFALCFLFVAVTASFAQMQVKNSPGTEVFMQVSPNGNVGVGTTLTPNKTNIAGNLAIGATFSALAASDTDSSDFPLVPQLATIRARPLMSTV